MPSLSDTAPDLVVDRPRPLAALLHSRLRGSHAPVIVCGDRTLPAASLWTAARALVADLRALGLTQGDRLLVVTEDDLLRAVALVAGLSSGIGIALATGPGPLAPIALDATAVDAALVLFAAVELAEVAKQQPAPSWCAAFALHGLLDRGGITLRPATPTPSLDAALLLREDHASGALTWHAYSQHTLADLLNARLVGLFGERWAPTDPQSRPAMVMASVLPWTHPAGVLYDLLFGLTAAEVMLRDTAAAEAPELLGDLLERAGAGAWLTLTVAVSDGFRAGSDRADDLMASLAGGLIASDSWDRYPPAATAMTITRAAARPRRSPSSEPAHVPIDKTGSRSGEAQT